jgi:hypothetical protein
MSSREVIPISGLSLREVRRNSSLVIASLFLSASLTRGLVLGRGIGQPIRRRRSRAPRWECQPGCWQLIWWPAVAAEQPSRRPHSVN